MNSFLGSLSEDLMGVSLSWSSLFQNRLDDFLNLFELFIMLYSWWWWRRRLKEEWMGKGSNGAPAKRQSIFVVNGEPIHLYKITVGYKNALTLCLSPASTLFPSIFPWASVIFWTCSFATCHRVWTLWLSALHMLHNLNMCLCCFNEFVDMF